MYLNRGKKSSYISMHFLTTQTTNLEIQLRNHALMIKLLSSSLYIDYEKNNLSIYLHVCRIMRQFPIAATWEIRYSKPKK